MLPPMINLISPSSVLRVSSTLKGSTNNSKENMLDGNPETCWYSNAGKSQFVSIGFESNVNVREIELSFGAGFASKKIEILVSKDDINKKNYEKIEEVEWVNDNENNMEKDSSNDNNTKLKFGKTNGIYWIKLNNYENKCDGIKSIKLIMRNFEDYYGRVVVHELKVLGYKNE